MEQTQGSTIVVAMHFPTPSVGLITESSSPGGWRPGPRHARSQAHFRVDDRWSDAASRDATVAIDPSRFVAALRRLTPEAGDPGDLTRLLVHDAWVASVAMLLRSVGPDLARANVIATQLTYSNPNGEFAAIRRGSIVAARPDIANVLEDLEAYGEATIELTVRLDADAKPAGVVELIFSISRQPDIRAHPR